MLWITAGAMFGMCIYVLGGTRGGKSEEGEGKQNEAWLKAEAWPLPCWWIIA